MDSRLRGLLNYDSRLTEELKSSTFNEELSFDSDCDVEGSFTLEPAIMGDLSEDYSEWGYQLKSLSLKNEITLNKDLQSLVELSLGSDRSVESDYYGGLTFEDISNLESFLVGFDSMCSSEVGIYISFQKVSKEIRKGSKGERRFTSNLAYCDPLKAKRYWLGLHKLHSLLAYADELGWEELLISFKQYQLLSLFLDLTSVGSGSLEEFKDWQLETLYTYAETRFDKGVESSLAAEFKELNTEDDEPIEDLENTQIEQSDDNIDYRMVRSDHILLNAHNVANLWSKEIKALYPSRLIATAFNLPLSRWVGRLSVLQGGGIRGKKGFKLLKKTGRFTKMDFSTLEREGVSRFTFRDSAPLIQFRRKTKSTQPFFAKEGFGWVYCEEVLAKEGGDLVSRPLKVRGSLLP